jgi:hypothetical protein
MLLKTLAVLVVLSELVFAAWLVVPTVSETIAVDRCLNHGGRWDYAMTRARVSGRTADEGPLKTCEYKPLGDGHDADSSP